MTIKNISPCLEINIKYVKQLTFEDDIFQYDIITWSLIDFCFQALVLLMLNGQLLCVLEENPANIERSRIQRVEH